MAVLFSELPTKSKCVAQIEAVHKNIGAILLMALFVLREALVRRSSKLYFGE